MYFYIYVLKSEKDGNNYVGYTSNLRKKLKSPKTQLKSS